MSRTYRAQDRYLPDDFDAELYWAESQRGERAEGRFFDPTDDEPEEEDDEPVARD